MKNTPRLYQSGGRELRSVRFPRGVVEQSPNHQVLGDPKEIWIISHNLDLVHLVQPAGNNRGGNAIGCKESARWLFEDRSAPPFPIRTTSRSARSASFGLRSQRRRTRGTSQGDIVNTSRDSYYNARGRNGFQNVPRSIYDFDGGNVFTKSYSPYTGARISGILPRPYGNRDNASLKGYSNGRRLRTPRLANSSFGRYGTFC